MRMVVECADQFWTACFLEGKMVAAVDSLNFKAKGVGERFRATAAWHAGVAAEYITPLSCWGNPFDVRAGFLNTPNHRVGTVEFGPWKENETGRRS